jgi:hypothetical protein
MVFSVRTSSAALGLVDFPVGHLVAGRLQPSPEYDSVEQIVRDATDAFLHLGLYDSVAPMLPPISAQSRRWRRALARASRLQLALVGPNGEHAPTDFVNLFDAPVDRGIVVLASFVSAPGWVSAALTAPLAKLSSGAPAA